MTSLADRSIDALRATHDELSAFVAGLSDEQLSARSGAGEWSVAQVLSHLGSGAEISRATLSAATGAGPAPASDFNQSVWDRWNALPPREQATGFVQSDEALVADLESLDADRRDTLRVDIGFLPEPIPLSTYTGMRLNEAAQHSWDARVSTDPDAAIAAGTAELLAEHFATDLAFLLGFTGKADAVTHAAVVSIDDSGYALDIADRVAVVTAAPAPTATFTGPLEAAIRLLAGRLTATHTPAGVTVDGNVTLEDLRKVFPGY